MTKAEFQEAMEKPIFDLDVIKRELDQADIYDDPFNDCKIQSFYFTTVFSFYPSGKYYMPWACSNVTEEEAEMDEMWREKAEEELATIDAYMFSGEGDPCDIFIGRNVEEGCDG